MKAYSQHYLYAESYQLKRGLVILNTIDTAHVIEQRIRTFVSAINAKHYDVARYQLRRLPLLLNQLENSPPNRDSAKRIRAAFRHAQCDSHAHVDGDNETLSLDGHFDLKKLAEKLIW